MPLSLPTIRDLQAQAAADLNAHVEGEDATVRRSFGWALSWATAGVAWGLYRLLEWVSRQVVPTSSESEALQRWCGLYGIVPDPGQQAAGPVTCTGTPGAPVTSGATLVRADGVRYSVTSTVAVGGGGSCSATVRALEPGVAGNMDAGTTLTFEASLAGVDATATTPDSITSGTDPELDASLLLRLSERVKRPPQGGARSDYVQWCRAALPGVVDQVWPVGGYPAQGQVTAYFSVVYDGSDPASVLPDGSQELAVQEYVEPLIPMDCDGFTAAAPTGAPVTLRIDLVEDTTANRAAVVEQLVALLQRRGAAAGGSTILNSELRAAIARGHEQYLLTSVNGDGTGLGDIAQSTGYLPYLSTVTWT